MQDAAVATLKANGSGFRGQSKFSTWFLRVAINERLMKNRNKSEHAMFRDAMPISEFRDLSGKDNPEASAISQELREKLMASVASLSPILREAVYAHHFLGMSLDETADALGVTVAAVKARMWRARAELRTNPCFSPQR